MKKKSRRLIAAVLLPAMLFGTAGCGKNTGELKPISPVKLQPEEKEEQKSGKLEKKPAEANTEERYAEILDKLCTLLITSGCEEGGLTGITGVLEAASMQETEDALRNVGYAIQDISGDGVPELLIGSIEEYGTANSSKSGEGREVFTIFNGLSDPCTVTLEGWCRSFYHYLGDGRFLYEGSSGASSYGFGTYAISRDGRELVCEEFYFGEASESDPAEMAFYYNKTGKWDAEDSEMLNIDAEEYWDLVTEQEEKTQAIEFTRFAGLAAERGFEIASEPPVSINWVDGQEENFQEFDRFQADVSEDSVIILLSSSVPVQDFRVLAISQPDLREDGELYFNTEELFYDGTLMPQRPLVMDMTFYGDTPGYGISYVDETGTTRYYAIDMSGYDSSLLLSEFYRAE